MPQDETQINPQANNRFNLRPRDIVASLMPQTEPLTTFRPKDIVRDLVSQQSVPFSQDTQRSPFTAYSAFAERQRQIPQDIKQRLESLAETTPLFTEAALNIAPVGLAKQVPQQAPRIFKGFKDLTTKFLEYAKGKTIFSKQEIVDFSRRPELKRGEADLLNRLGSEVKETKIPAQEFADSIRRDLLPLKPVNAGKGFRNITIENRGGKSYDTYEEVVFESPIKTNGSSHYPNSEGYFAHARGGGTKESGKKIWEENEIQSDLLQKGEIDRLTARAEGARDAGINPRAVEEVEKLQPFTNDRFGERIMRERIKEKAQQGYEKYRLPTGETIGKIEGFQQDNWFDTSKYWGGNRNPQPLKPTELKVGMEINQTTDRLGDEWIITDILGDGRFKAVTKKYWDSYLYDDLGRKVSPEKIRKEIRNFEETFDLTGKSNPQYRRYSDWGKFLKNKYGGKEVIDPQGNSWMEIDLKPEFKKLPIEAFGVLPFLQGRDSENNKRPRDIVRELVAQKNNESK